MSLSHKQLQLFNIVIGLALIVFMIWVGFFLTNQAHLLEFSPCDLCVEQGYNCVKLFK